MPLAVASFAHPPKLLSESSSAGPSPSAVMPTALTCLIVQLVRRGARIYSGQRCAQICCSVVRLWFSPTFLQRSTYDAGLTSTCSDYPTADASMKHFLPEDWKQLGWVRVQTPYCSCPLSEMLPEDEK